MLWIRSADTGLRPVQVPCAALLLGLLFGASGAADPGFEILPLPPETPGAMRAEGISGDGCTVVGWGGGDARPVPFRWKYGATHQIPVRSHPLPASQKGRAYDVSDDGSVVAGDFEQMYYTPFSFRWEASAPEELDSLWDRTSAVAVSSDGRVVQTDGSLRWVAGSTEHVPGVHGGTVSSMSGNGAVVAGWDRPPGSSEDVALRWEDGTETALGVLPDADWSEAHGISVDGRVVVGTSGSRAFRWADGAMSELGGGAEIARSVSRDGSRIVGRGAAGAFLWDPENGTRDLRAVLEDNHGFALGDWSLVDATGISDDGFTIVGHATNSLGEVRAWRAALGERGCPPPASFEEAVSFPLPSTGQNPHSRTLPGDLAVASNGDVFVASGSMRASDDVWVVRVLASDHPLDHGHVPGWELVMDATGDGVGNPLSGIIHMDVAPDDTLYVVGTESQNGFRVDPETGEIAEIFDLAAGEIVDEIVPWPGWILVAPDGALLVATLTKALRFDPDGTVIELLDALTAKELLHPGFDIPPGSFQEHLYRVFPHPSGDFLVSSPNAIFRVTPEGDASVLFDVNDPIGFPVPGYLADMFDVNVDRSGKIWFRESQGALWTISEEGPVPVGPLPDGKGGELDGIDGLWLDELGNLIVRDQSKVVRLTQDLVATPLVDGDSPWSGGVGFVWDVAAHLDAETGLHQVFLSTWREWGLVRVNAPHPPFPCTDGIDNDGDGAVDYRSDPGCLSPYDESEDLVALPEPGAWMLLATGIATLAGLGLAVRPLSGSSGRRRG